MAEIEKWLFGFTKLQIVLIISLAIYLLVLAKITQPVDTTLVERFNNQTNQTFTREYYIVPNYVNQNYLITGFILLLGLVMAFLVKEGKGSNMITIEEAIQIMDSYLKKRKSIITSTGQTIDIGTYHIDPNFLLTEDITDAGRIPNRYVLQIRIIDTDEREFYLKGYVHPFKRYIGGFVEMEGALEGKERCTQCGEEYDVKILSTEEYKKWLKVKGDFKGE